MKTTIELEHDVEDLIKGRSPTVPLELAVNQALREYYSGKNNKDVQDPNYNQMLDELDIEDYIERHSSQQNR